MAERLQRFLATLSPRERVLLLVGALVCTVAVVTFGVIEPLGTARQEAAREVAERRELLNWLSSRASEAEAIREALEERGVTPVEGTAGIAEVESSLEARGLRSSLVRLAPGRDGGIEARFEDVSYTALTQWLARSGRRLGLVVTTMELEARDAPDQVDAEFTAVIRGEAG